MTREEFINSITSFNALMDFCNDEGYYEYVSDYHHGRYYEFWDDEANSYIENYDTWEALLDDLSNIRDICGTNNYWYYNDYYGEWECVDQDRFEYTFNDLLEALENDGFFDAEENEENREDEFGIIEDEPELEVEEISISDMAVCNLRTIEYSPEPEPVREIHETPKEFEEEEPIVQSEPMELLYSF